MQQLVEQSTHPVFSYRTLSGEVAFQDAHAHYLWLKQGKNTSSLPSHYQLVVMVVECYETGKPTLELISLHNTSLDVTINDDAIIAYYADALGLHTSFPLEAIEATQGNEDDYCDDCNSHLYLISDDAPYLGYTCNCNRCTTD